MDVRMYCEDPTCERCKRQKGDNMDEDDFTEEEAALKLNELGFEVMDLSGAEFLGFAIEPRLDGWGVNEILRTPGTFDRHVIVWSPRFDTIAECLEWLGEVPDE